MTVPIFCRGLKAEAIKPNGVWVCGCCGKQIRVVA